MTDYRCALCGNTYDLDQPRRTTRYCEPCRTRRRATQLKLRDSRRNRARENVVDVLNAYTSQGMDVDYVGMMRDHLDAIIDEVIPEDRAHPELPLRAAFTPAGPDEGTSTYFADLADELDAHASRVAVHPWWTHHSEWADGLDFNEIDEILRAS